jgi:F-box protein 11
MFRRCRIHDGKRGGVMTHTAGRGAYEDCDIFGDVHVGMAIWADGDPVVRRSKIHDNQECGVMVFKPGRGTFENRELLGCGFRRRKSFSPS